MSDEQATPEVAAEDAGIQQIPATAIQAVQDPTATVAREKLLGAIGREADYLADNQAGQASTALEELARAYALLVTGPTAVAAVASGAARMQQLNASEVSAIIKGRASATDLTVKGTITPSSATPE
ncbi:hypothetical protein [Nocardia sp. NPDC051570]|uniref:hypothetical protein n=1 Tax=Nocardia sp. NPDC051570 TaxID=3364324 RepID=UPI003799533C